jgi:hypothetical protein
VRQPVGDAVFPADAFDERAEAGQIGEIGGDGNGVLQPAFLHHGFRFSGQIKAHGLHAERVERRDHG